MIRSFRQDLGNIFGERQNLVTRLIIINLMVFLAFAFARFTLNMMPPSVINAEWLDQNHLVSRDLKNFITHPWTLFFHPFTHKGFLSLFFDLIILYWFGNMLADIVGGQKMVVVYLTGALVGLVFFFGVWGVFSLLNSSINVGNPYLYGSSAGGFAVMLAYVALNPESEIMLFTIRLKTRWLVLALLFLSILSAPAQGILDLGGAVFGYLQMKMLRSGINLTYGLERLYIWVANLFKSEKPTFNKRFSAKPEFKKKPSKSYPFPLRDDYPSQDEIDYLLDKISKLGYDKLTDDEKHRLHKASQKID